MPLLVNLRHLEKKDVTLEGELPVEELELDIRDEVIQAKTPLKYHIEVQQMEESLLAQGHLQLTLDCECVRCLKPFQDQLEIKRWSCLIPLKGEEAAPLNGDFVDLTPYVREDILLEFPQHPLCDAECGGLPADTPGETKKTNTADQAGPSVSAWSELNKLRF